jgi:predicted secreted protein
VALPGLKRVVRGALLVVAATLLVAGCASRKVYREGASTIVGAVGDDIVIELASDPATGYSWTLVGQADPRVVTLFETDYVQGTAAGSGTAGHQRWTFRLVGPGSTAITFGYGRTWANTPAEKATLFNVTAR